MAFAIHTRGAATPGQKVFRYQSRDTGRTTEFYPERGLVSIHHEMTRGGDEQYERVSRKEFLIRAAALSLEVAKLLQQAHDDATHARRYRQEATELQRLVECMVAVAVACKDQGDPFVAADLDQAVADARPRIWTPGADFETPLPPMPTPRPDAPVISLAGDRAGPPRRVVVR